MKLNWSGLRASLIILVTLWTGAASLHQGLRAGAARAGLGSSKPSDPDRIDRVIARKAREVLRHGLDDVADTVPWSTGENLTDADHMVSGCWSRFKIDAEYHPTRCPDRCPLFAEVPAHEGSFCEFRCVEASPKACSAVNTENHVVSVELHMCTPCNLAGCEQCTTDNHLACAKCEVGFTLANGACYSNFWVFWIVLFSLVGGIIVLLAAWVNDLAHRKIINAEMLKKALLLRSRSKLHTPYEEQQDAGQGSGSRRLYPFSTNLLNQVVAGPGLVLSFNFQFWVIIWAFTVAIAWLLLGTFVDKDVLVLGTKAAETIRDYCHVVAWGYDTQQRLMWTKSYFLFWLYLITFIGSILHSIRQRRMFELMDVSLTTHKDFCARCTFEGTLEGTECIEADLQEALQIGLGCQVVGVSVCWDYAKHEQEVMSYLSLKVMEREVPGVQDRSRSEDAHCADAVDDSCTDEDSSSETRGREEEEEEVVAPKRGCLHKCVKIHNSFMRPIYKRIEHFYLAPATQRIVTKERMSRGSVLNHAVKQPQTKVERAAQVLHMQNLVKKLHTTGEAFAVFSTESARDNAVKTSSELPGGGVRFGNTVVRLEPAICEPDALHWANCTHPSWCDVVKRVAYGVVVISMALLCWALLFYFPYAYYITSYDYSSGTIPDLVPMMTFTLVVVCGNALMYFVCSVVAERVGFRYQDHREVCYMLLYCFSCMVNVVLDLCTTYVMVYSWMAGKGVRTHDGLPLSKISTFTEAFSAYPMQRALGEQLLLYAFPGTFLYPFLFEPLLSIVLPYQLMSYIVRSHKEVSLQEAERYLSSPRMDLSRYADLHVNIILGTISFFFPGGFIHWMFFFLALSHCYIYLYDHWRVLRSIPKCEFSGMGVDWWAQWLTSVSCGILAAACVFKFNCEPGMHCRSGLVLVAMCSAAGAGHVLLHTLLLVYFVPLFRVRNRPPSPERYERCSRRLPCSWFNANPIQCIRSELLYNHSPPCDYFFPGKEHLLRENRELGLYFFDEHMSETEAFDRQFSALMRDVSDVLSPVSRKSFRASSWQSSASPASPSHRSPQALTFEVNPAP